MGPPGLRRQSPSARRAPTATPCVDREGRLTVEEFDERVVRAHGSVYLDELPPLVADLPREAAPQQRPVRRRPSGPPPAFVVLISLLLAWSVVAAVVHGAPPFFALLLLFLCLRHRRWSRRW